MDLLVKDLKVSFLSFPPIVAPMSISSINAHAFYEEVARSKTVWAIRDEGGVPAPVNSDGERAMPFWSSEQRALTFISQQYGYTAFAPFSIDWEAFCNRWIPGMTDDGLLAGINWTGERASGYDLKPSEVKENVEAVMGV